MVRSAKTRVLARLAAGLTALGSMVFDSVPAAAQELCLAGNTQTLASRCEPPRGAGSPRLAGHAATLGANAVIGGLTAGIAQASDGKPFWRGFVRGALGGSIVYSGKLVGGESFPASGLLGREISAVGSSMVANAATGRGTFEQIVLPVGPIRLHIQPSSSAPIHARVDLANLAVTAYTAAQPGLEFDWRSSLSSGTPVFTDYADRPWLARQSAGVIVVRDRDLPPELRRESMNSSLGHERVHVAQQDFNSIVWGGPSERKLLQHVPNGAQIHRFVEFRIDLLPWAAANALLRYDLRPWEWEAHFLTGQPELL